MKTASLPKKTVQKPIKKQKSLKLIDTLYNGCYFKVPGEELYFLLTNDKDLNPVGPVLRSTIFKPCINEFDPSSRPDLKIKKMLDEEQKHLHKIIDCDGNDLYLFEHNKPLRISLKGKSRKGAWIVIPLTKSLIAPCPFNLSAAAQLPVSTLPDIDTSEPALKYQV